MNTMINKTLVKRSAVVTGPHGATSESPRPGHNHPSVCVSHWSIPRSLGIALATAGLAALTACQTNPARGTDTPLSEAQQTIEAGIRAHRNVQPPPPEVQQALLRPQTPAPKPRPQRSEQRYDINVNNVPANDFFMGLVEGTPYNMVVHPQVEGNISLNLKRLTVPQILDIARDAYGYEYRRTAYGFQVLPARLRSHIFRVNYLNVQRSGSSQTRVSSGQVSQVERRSSDEQENQNGNTVVTGTEINTVQPETTFWSELRNSIAAILGGAPGRSVVVNPQSGVVVVRAMPQELREIREYLEATQAITSRQVILEAKIVEVELKSGFQSGINWSAMFKSGSKTATVTQTGGGTVFGDNGVAGTAGNTGDLNPASPDPILATAAAAFGGVFSVALNLNDVTAFLELLKSQGNVQVLSSPRVSTLNNQKAVIKVGSDEFFVTDISSTTVTGTTTTTTPSVELTPFFSGIALDVTPQISEEGDVILHVHPSVSEVEDQQKSVTIGNTTQQIPLAFSTVRESDSVVRARSGQLVVIGGLMRNQVRDEQAAPPVLGDLPYVGGLFQHNREVARKTELVILLRPLVVAGPESWAESLSRAGEGLSRLQRAAP